MICYQLVIAMVMMNLFVAVVLQGFDNLSKHESSSIKPIVLERFIENWSNYDKKGAGFISSRELNSFLSMLPPPLGWKGKNLT
jgi:hypothetical protein